MLNALIAGEPTTADVLEKTTPRYTFVLEDNTGTAIPVASLSTLTLYEYVLKADGTVSAIRGTAASPQNVKNANNVTVDSNGVGVWLIQTTDTTMVEAVPVERHVCLWTWTWATGTGRHELWMNVKNLSGVS